jgi:hypothetical protein
LRVDRIELGEIEAAGDGHAVQVEPGVGWAVRYLVVAIAQPRRRR